LENNIINNNSYTSHIQKCAAQETTPLPSHLHPPPPHSFELIPFDLATYSLPKPIRLCKRDLARISTQCGMFLTEILELLN
jgi:hypothetical protein